MQKWMMGVAAVAALALTGCGSLCDDLAGADEKFEEKYSPCLDTGETYEKFNVNQCDSGIDKCTDAEQEALSELADCIRDLPECSPATEQSFDNALEACRLSLLGKIGETCATAALGP